MSQPEILLGRVEQRCTIFSIMFPPPTLSTAVYVVYAALSQRFRTKRVADLLLLENHYLAKILKSKNLSILSGFNIPGFVPGWDLPVFPKKEWDTITYQKIL